MSSPRTCLIAHTTEGLLAKISDFGLAKSFRGVGLSGLTFSGEMRGTVPFMPPEQMLDFKTVTPLADLYATAATLYYLLTCKYIYDEPAGGGDLIRMLLEEQPVPIRTRRPDVPQPLATVIGQCLARDPKERLTRCQFDAAGAQTLLLNCAERDSLLAPRVVVIVLPRRAEALVDTRIMVALRSPRIGVGSTSSQRRMSDA